jgi:hypothetical protein
VDARRILTPSRRKKKPIRYARNSGNAIMMSQNTIAKKPKNCIKYSVRKSG